MKFDYKNPITIILVFVVLVLVYIIFFGGNKYKDENVLLRKEVRLIQKQRDSIVDQRKIDVYKQDSIESVIELRETNILEINKRLSRIESDLILNNNELEVALSKIESYRGLIKDLDKDPKKRIGDDLINSLKIKLNK